MNNSQGPSFDGPAGATEMRLSGSVYKDGKHWIAEVTLLEAMTQGRSRKDALSMIADWIETMVDHAGFSAEVHPGTNGHFEISSNDPPRLIALLLRRQRERSGLSIEEVATRLGVKSPAAYARYERGAARLPSLEKLEELLAAVAPDRALVLTQNEAP
jgi:predicted RNase H-like HicB family nuclease